ncbi:hypothetical protein FMM58_05435 [Campylobacter sp. LR291e]|nr:hypothetical protein FMM55_08265 [Campylobacter sp. LR196d]KAA6225305.1 hypothetical protein FMM57_07945 [Campylobacter sp. LR286c]KAA6225576.1 hypothetical protein FMM54_05975 [Campylobacter sp. LR185c]KAA6230430.1 hypothetical protein FMM58_05435 [Campylobacter sp. LR291e]KAA6230544.1 hypothetical protein FMM56_06000 [Campylobacter sp. LR264d]
MLISRIFIKNNILHILTKSNVARQEFNHDSTKNEIKFRIKKYANMYKDSPFKYIKDIKILSIKFNDKTKIAYKPLPKAPYIELSLAKFENNFKNPIFYQKMEELRQIIKKNINE